MTEIRYLDFDLLIARSGDGYVARVLNSPAGQAAVGFRLPFSTLELENFLLRVGRTRRGVRRLESSEMQAAKAFGGRLFNAVFGGEVRGCLRSSLDEASRQRAGVRVRLRLAEVPELADVPWEYLYNPALNRFMVLSVETPLVRYLDLPERIRPLAVKPPLRVLVMISCPSDYPQLDVEQEWTRLREALGDLEQRGLVALERLEHATLVALQRRLRQEEYHIFHFMGHGGFDERAQDGVLLLEDAAGRSSPASGQYLGTLLHDERTLRLAVLNACEGARTSRTDPFAGTAQSLVQQGIPAVVAMQFEITDDAAVTLAHEFYAALADGYPVDAALGEARKAIFAQENDVEWGKPVLYMRSPDGYVFDIAPVSEEERKSTHVDVLPARKTVPSTFGRWSWAFVAVALVLLLGGAPWMLTSVLRPTRTPEVVAPTDMAKIALTHAPTLVPTSTSLPIVEPVASDEYMVLVAQLEPLEAEERDVSRFIVDDLVQVLEKGVPFSKIRIREYPGIIVSDEAALAAAEANGATMVVWGSYTQEFIQLEVQLGVTKAFPLIQIPRETLERTANVRARMADEREESVAPQVLGVLTILESAAGDGYEVMRTLAILDEILDETDTVGVETVGDSVATHMHRAYALFSDDPLRAVDEIDSALDLDAGNPLLYAFRNVIYWRLQRYDDARRDAETASRLGPDQWAIPLYLLGNDAFLLNDVDRAISYYDQIAELRQDDWFPFNYRGALYYLKGEYDLAKADYERAFALGPNANFPHVFSTMIALREGRVADAVALMNVVLRDFPDPLYVIRVERGVLGDETPGVFGPTFSAFAWLIMGQWDAAIRDTEAALTIDDRLADLYFMQGFAYCNLKEYAAAEEAYTRGIEIDTGFTFLYLLRADVRFKQNNMTGALDDIGTVERSELGGALAAYVQVAQSGEFSCENLLPR